MDSIELCACTSDRERSSRAGEACTSDRKPVNGNPDSYSHSCLRERSFTHLPGASRNVGFVTLAACG